MNKLLTSLLLICSVSIPCVSFGWTYPLKQVSKVECKFTSWETHSQDCKMDLPIIKGAEYDKYKKNTTYRLVYSVLWSSTYDNGWDIGNGSHLGVDFATAKGTPVYAAGDGSITVAGWLNGRGNAVVIKHSFNGKYIYSSYNHMDKVVAKKGATVKEGDLIGYVGKTGNAYGNHLHFQIDVNQTGSHPYYHTNCGEDDILENVNKGLCKDKVAANTIDPIYFLETNGAKLNIGSIGNETKIEQENKQYQEEKKIDPSEIANRKQLQMTEMELYLNRYTISTQSNIVGNNLYVGAQGNIGLNVNTKWDNRPYDGFPPMDIELVYDSKKVSVVPDTIKYIEKGKRDIVVKAKATGSTTISIKMGEKIIGTYKIRIIDGKTVIDPSNAQAIVVGKPYIGNQTFGIVVFKDTEGMNVINVPYKGNYSITASQNANLCAITITNLQDISSMVNKVCTREELTNKVDFTYDTSLKGIVLFKIIPYNIGEVKFDVLKNGKKIFSSNGVKALAPIDLYTNISYYKEIVEMLQSGTISNLTNGYFAPDFNITEADTVTWIKQSFSVNNNIYGDKYKNITRIEFFKLINQITGLKSSDNSNVFWDIKEDQRYLGNLLLDYDFRFSDTYGNKYFQPDKKLTRKEAAFVLRKLQK